MTSLQKRTYHLWLALCLVVGLTILPAITAPLIGDELANWLPGTTAVYAEESHNGGG